MSNTVTEFPWVSRTWTKTSISASSAHPVMYISIVLITVLTSLVYQLRKETILACQATLYSSDRYIASCNGTHYADYEHGAFAFDLEPRAENFARDADVLFLGNSRLQ